MRRLLMLCLLVVCACGSKIGDACIQATDCGAAEDVRRFCDETSPDGYCTIAACDVDTCPEDSVCVQFFPVLNLEQTCTSQTDCSFDQICTVGGYCAARASEARFCMATCGSPGDCRDQYECRGLERMGRHGGETVLREGQTDGDRAAFCAAALPCSVPEDCDCGDTCDTASRRCQPGALACPSASLLVGDEDLISRAAD
jgi:hypothetical protein